MEAPTNSNGRCWIKCPTAPLHPWLYKGDGHQRFIDQSDTWGTSGLNGYFNGAAYADLDNDGRLDIVINCLNAPAVILKNNAPPKHYLTLSFSGDGLNTSGIGAKAYVYVGAHTQYQQLMLTRGFMSSCEPRLHFGLDSATQADSILVVWPDQRFQLLKQISANRVITLRQTDATARFSYTPLLPKKRNQHSPTSATI